MNGKKLTKDDMLHNLKVKYGNRYEFEILSIDGRNKTRVAAVCNNCNNKHVVSYRTLIDFNFTCPKCQREPVNKLKSDYVFEKIRKLNYEILDGEYKNQDSKFTLKCLDCGTVFTTSYKWLRYKKKGCVTCQYNSMRKSSDDIKKEIFEIYNGSIEPISEYHGVNHKMIFRCNICGNVWENTADSVINKHIGCHVCAKGVSYPNKLMKLILLKFIHDDDIFDEEILLKKISNEWTGRHRFDFRYNNYIIEMDGGMSHEDKTVDNQKDAFAKKCGLSVIRIDAKYSGIKQRLNTLKNNILNSELSNIFDFSKITEKDWILLDRNAQETSYREIYDYYIEHKNEMTITQISKNLHKNWETIKKAINFFNK